MIGALKALFETSNADNPDERERHTRMAAAALMIETARADFAQDESEQKALETLLSTSLSLSEAEVAALMKDAENRVDEATSLYEFTRVINDYYSAEEKLGLIDAMWAVAYADGNIHKYEEHLIRQVAELTYVPHGDYIRSKLNAAGA